MAEERKDRRGVKPGDQSKPKGRRREGTVDEGLMGQAPHRRNEDAAKQIELLAGFGLPLHQVTTAVEALFDDQGYSVDTLQRHYRKELDRGIAKAKTELIQGAYDIALGRNIPEGVTPDKAYAERGKKIEWLLNAVHKVVPHQNHRHGGEDGGAIPVSFDLSSLTDDDLDTLERLSKRLSPARTDQG